MNNLPLITQFILTGLGGFLIGMLITPLFKRGNSKQQAELEEAKKALQDYREAVNHHFIDTAEAVDELTRSYQNVFAQLSHGAEELMTPEAYRNQLEQRSGQSVTLSYLAEQTHETAGNAEQRIQLVPHDVPVPPQNDLDEADSAADATVFNPTNATESAPAASPEQEPAPAAEPAAAAAPAADPNGTLVDLSETTYRFLINSSVLHDAVLLQVERDGCLLTLTVKIQADGSYTLEVWDDQVLIGSLPFSGSAGDIRTLQYLMTANVGTLWSGYDFTIRNARDQLVSAYDWDFEGSQHVMDECHQQACAGGGGTGVTGTGVAGTGTLAEPLAAAPAVAEPAAAPAAPAAPAAQPAAPAVAGSELAYTGAQTLELGTASAFLLGVGAVALHARRRRA